MQVDGRKRVVYRITRKGEKKLATSIDRWRTVVAAVNAIFSGDRDVKPAEV